MLELFVEFLLLCRLWGARGVSTFLRMLSLMETQWPFMTRSTDCNGSWETSAACCCWHELLTPNRPTWWRRRSRFSQPSVSLERKTCEWFSFFERKNNILWCLDPPLQCKYTGCEKSEIMFVILNYCSVCLHMQHNTLLREKAKTTALSTVTFELQ